MPSQHRFEAARKKELATWFDARRDEYPTRSAVFAVVDQEGILFSYGTGSLDERKLTEAVGQVNGIVAGQSVLGLRLDSATSSADLCWHVDGKGGRLSCRIEMTETRPLLIQRLESGSSTS